MRVAIVTTAGVTRQFRQWPEAILGRALVARGHKVAAFTTFEEGSDITGQRREDVDGIDTHRLSVSKVWTAPGLVSALLRFRPDVIHLFHLRNALNWQATLLARLLRVPVVFTVVGPFHDPYLVDDRAEPHDRQERDDRHDGNERGPRGRRGAADYTGHGNSGVWLAGGARR